MAYEFEVRGQKYRADKMSGRTQTHVFRRMSTIVGRLVQIAQAQDKAKHVLLLAEAISELPDEAVDYILDRCLQSVERRQGADHNPIWSPVKPAEMQDTMFSDIEMDDELEIAGHIVYLNFWPIIKKNLERFKPGLADSLSNFSPWKMAPSST